VRKDAPGIDDERVTRARTARSRLTSPQPVQLDGYRRILAIRAVLERPEW